MDKYNSEGYLDPTAAQALARVAREERWKPCVFICSPFAGNIGRNTQKAKGYLKLAVEKGAIPFAPHLLYPWVLNDKDPAQRKLGLFFGTVWLGKCDQLWVFGSEISNGMRIEIAKAEKRRIPIKYFTENGEEVQGL